MARSVDFHTLICSQKLLLCEPGPTPHPRHFMTKVPNESFWSDIKIKNGPSRLAEQKKGVEKNFSEKFSNGDFLSNLPMQGVLPVTIFLFPAFDDCSKAQQT